MMETANKWKKALARTSKVAFGRIALVLGTTEISDSTWDDLEESLIQSDFGYKTAHDICTEVKNLVYQSGITTIEDVKKTLLNELRKRLDSPSVLKFDGKPFVILMVGVNGSGKTTTAAKLGSIFQAEGKKVIFVAADTFRAAAIDQLTEWSQRLGILCISGSAGSDPGSIVYDGIQTAIKKEMDVVIIDTAGRLQTNTNLMEEIKKISRVAGKSLEGAPHESWLVLDATTGQNSIQQARKFSENINISGIIIAKLDTSAKGGMVFSIQNELNIPILYAGLGENVEDLRQFNPDEFISGLMI
jgi:fused signal recognition particle receptor